MELPHPIPNWKVKRLSVDNTRPATDRENRSSPGQFFSQGATLREKNPDYIGIALLASLRG